MNESQRKRKTKHNKKKSNKKNKKQSTHYKNYVIRRHGVSITTRFFNHFPVPLTQGGLIQFFMQPFLITQNQTRIVHTRRVAGFA